MSQSLETCCAVGKYKVEVFDKDKHIYMPTGGGLGMHVEVKDPEDKTLMSRVSICECFVFCCLTITSGHICDGVLQLYTLKCSYCQLKFNGYV